MSKRWFAGSMTAFAAVLLALSAGATGVGGAPPAFLINGAPVDLSSSCATPEGVEVCSGSASGETFQVPQFQLAANPDPFVSLALAVLNPTSSDQTYTFTAVAPVAPVGPGLQLNGSFGGSLTDVDGNGATLVDATGAPLYVALIDGAPVRSLLDPPQSFTTTTTVDLGPAAFGPEVFAGSVTSFIAIQVQFTLSPGDAASFTSVFNAVPVPEPGTLMLLASGVGGIAAWGRRRA